MISGHLCDKRGYYYAVLNLYDENGKRKKKWFSTGLKSKANKKRAEKILMDLRIQYSNMEKAFKRSHGIYFHEYMLLWIEHMRHKLSPVTYVSYELTVKKSIIPFFEQKRIRLSELKHRDIEDYYNDLLDRGLSANSVIHHHANIHKALKEACHKGFILTNPAEIATRPKKESFITFPYSTEETNKLLEAIQGERMEVIIKLAAFYGLRRSEVLGLKWKAINFNDDTLFITHSVGIGIMDGSYAMCCRDKLKRNSSFRTLPLTPAIKELLLRLAEERYENKKPNPEDYICIDKKGQLIKPNYISKAFSQLLKKHGLRHIRFHDLRHGCASILISERIPLIEVQQWLGHSSIQTTADMYAHLDYSIKMQSAKTMEEKLNI